MKRDASGNFTAGTITAALSGNASTATTAGSTANFSGSLVGDVTGTQGATVVSTVGGVTAASVASGANLANGATDANTATAIVRRDGAGGFSAGVINATSAVGGGLGTVSISNTGAGAGIIAVHSNTTGTDPGVSGSTNSTAASAFGVLGTVTAINGGGSSAGVRGVNNSTNGSGMGVYGSHAGAGFGIYGTTANGTTTSGVYGTSTALGGNGVIGEASTSSGSYGVWGKSNAGHAVHGDSSSGYGVYASTISGNGVYASSTSGNGVHGYSSSSTGVFGQTNVSSSTSAGVVGDNSAASGTGVIGRCNAAGGAGVAGVADGTSSTGVYGRGSTYAGNFDGNVRVGGTLSKSAGSFKIDHPLDPANKYLSHSFVESPDMMNIYNGNVTTNADGDATIVMPPWFEALNQDFRYQLTVLGQFAQVMVASKIKGNQFAIKTDKPAVEVSWQVTGIRHDAYASAHPIVVEETKPATEAGLYEHPELFGQPEEKGVSWAAHPRDKNAGKGNLRPKAPARSVGNPATSTVVTQPTANTKGN